MIINKKLYQQVLADHKITSGPAIVYRYQGKFGCSNCKQKLWDPQNPFSLKIYDFLLEIPGKDKIRVKNVVWFEMFVPRSPGQKEIDDRPGLIYNNHPGEAILEETDIDNFFLVFKCKTNDVGDVWDWYVYHNNRLVHVFENVKTLGYDKYNFILEDILFTRVRLGEEDQVWAYQKGQEKPLNNEELSFGTWSFFFGGYIFREYSCENAVSPYEICISDEKPVLWECREKHVWEESVLSRVRTERQGISAKCPICAELYEKFQKKSKAEKSRITKGIEKQIEEYSNLLCEGVFWDRGMQLPDQVEYYFLYPNGKNSDITCFLAQKYGQVQQVDGLLHRASFFSENYEWFDCLFVGSGRNLPPPTSREFEKKNAEYHSFMRHYYLPYKLQELLSDCRIKSMEISEACRGKYEAAMKMWRDVQASKRKAVYDMLLVEGRSSSRWTMEQQMFFVIKAMFPDAVFQYRSDWLEFQSLDVFIPSISVGIEYQGKQHYMPIEFFGGEQGFRDRQRLDRKKKEKCRQREIDLIEWRYDEPVNKEMAEIKLSRWL